MTPSPRPVTRATRASRASTLVRRARRRRQSRGAVLFIVAVTLGLLAVMGVYGLSATSADIRASGHMREALQGQRAGEAALMMTAETFNPTIAQNLVQQMNLGQGQAKDCITASPYTGNVASRAAESCIRLDPTKMQTIALATSPTNPWQVDPAPAQPGFSSQSFGAVTNQPFVSIEVTNPINTEVMTGNSQTVRYSQLTATVFVKMKKNSTSAPETQVVGRGRITVGPSLANAGAPSNF